MKITTEAATFAPITIVIESLAEAQVLATLAGAMSNRTEEAITGVKRGPVAEALFASLLKYNVSGARIRITVGV